MSFARYLRENRHQVIDHRNDAAPVPPGVPIDAEALDGEPPPEVAPRRGRPRRAAFRPVRPAFAPSFYTTPLPYIEPWERR